MKRFISRPEIDCIPVEHLGDDPDARQPRLGDLAFRTYVNVIPEPSTIHLALFSLGAALLRRLRKT